MSLAVSPLLSCMLASAPASSNTSATYTHTHIHTHTHILPCRFAFRSKGLGAPCRYTHTRSVL